MSTSLPNPGPPTPIANARNQPEYQRSSSLSRSKMMLLGGFAASLLVFMVGAGLDWIVLHESHSRNLTISVSDTLAALIAGILVFRLLQYERDRREQVRQRLEIIAEMNHHVRNALQVISLSTYSYADRQQLEAVKESVSRIQWALKEVLPKL